MENAIFSKSRKAHLGQSTSHGLFFLVRNYIHKFCYNNDYTTAAKTYLRHAIFCDCTIAVKL